MRELAEFVPKLANFEEYLYSKFEKGLSLEIREKMPITRSQSYKKVVQLVLRVEKLTSERMSRVTSGNSSGSGSRSISSPQSIRSPQPFKLGTSPSGFTFRGRMMTKRCPNYRQFHTSTYGMPHVCFHYGQTDHVKRFY